MPNCAITTATIIEMQGFKDGLFGVSCLHGTHVGSTSFFTELYPEKGAHKKIMSSDYDRILLFIKNEGDMLTKIERVESSVRN